MSGLTTNPGAKAFAPHLLKTHECRANNAEHSGDLGMATKEPWKGRPAAIGRVLLRLVKGLFTLGFYWAPNAECQLPILCASLTHCARNQATE